MMEQFDRDTLRREFSRLGWALIASQLVMLGLSLFGSLVGGEVLRLFSPLRGTWQLLQGYIVIFAVVMGTLPMLHLGYTSGRLDRIFDRGEKIWPVQLAFYFLMILGLQMMVTLLTSPLIDLLESMGLSFAEASHAATSFSSSGSLLFYSIAVAPICEELIYRGCLLRYLERYGRWFAIFMSALVFGLMHGNAVQFPIAFIIGVVFAYLALKHSLRLVILLHVMNNLFVELIGRLAAVNEPLGVMVNAGLMLAGFVSLILMLLSGGKPLLRDLRANKTPREVYVNFFTCLPVAAIFLYMLSLTVSSVLGL